MAEKRMFSKSIIDSDAFLEMPVTSQLLYFHLSMRADDDGFINKPKAIMRIIGAKDDDIKVLFTRKFVIPFESGVVVIKHWRINNYIRNDTYHETNYKEEKSLLTLDENNSYTLSVTNPLQVSNETETQNRLDKTRLDKNKYKYGDYSNVALSDDERLKLDEKFGDKDTEAIIQWFSAYIEEKGYKCKSHYLAILRWVGDAYYESLKRKPKQKEAIPSYKQENNPSYDEELFQKIMEKRNES